MANLIDTRTTQIEWRDVTISTPGSDTEQKKKGGRPLGDVWVEAFDNLNTHMRLDKKYPAEAGPGLADRLVEALEATVSIDPLRPGECSHMAARKSMAGRAKGNRKI